MISPPPAIALAVAAPPATPPLSLSSLTARSMPSKQQGRPAGLDSRWNGTRRASFSPFTHACQSRRGVRRSVDSTTRVSATLCWCARLEPRSELHRAARPHSGRVQHPVPPFAAALTSTYTHSWSIRRRAMCLGAAPCDVIRLELRTPSRYLHTLCTLVRTWLPHRSKYGHNGHT